MLPTRLLFAIFLPVVLALSACDSDSKRTKSDDGPVAAAARLSAKQGTVAFEANVDPAAGRPNTSGVIDFGERRAMIVLPIVDESDRYIIDGRDLYWESTDDPVTWDLTTRDPDWDWVDDPREIFLDLRHVEDETSISKGSIRGQSAMRFDFDLDIEHVFGAVGETLWEDGAFAKSVEASAWIDDGGLIRRLEFRLVSDSPESDEETLLWVEYYDYGKAPSVELPDSADVNDLSTPLGSPGAVSADDYFRGAACYGDRIEECLAPNPEIDAIAQDPSLCTGAEKRVCLVAVGNVRRDVVDAIIEFHKRTKNIDIVVLPSLPVERTMVSSESQVINSELRRQIYSKFAVTDQMPSTFIGITPFDTRPENGEFSWYFGARYSRAWSGENDGVFSTFRIENVPPYNGEALTDEFVQGRVTKYFARYVALIYFDYAPEGNPKYLNFSDMYGIGDLDDLQPNWPIMDPPPSPASICKRFEPVICLVLDARWEDAKFESDAQIAAQRLEDSIGITVGVTGVVGFIPTQESWSAEFREDLRKYAAPISDRAGLMIIGVTDDALSQAASVPVHTDAAWPAENLAIVSGYDAGRPGTAAHQERLYRLLLRAVARVHADQPLAADPASLLFEGITAPAQVDGKTLPVLR